MLSIGLIDLLAISARTLLSFCNKLNDKLLNDIDL